MPSRVLVVGIDSVPLDLMLPWASSGHLPAFGKILSTGSYGDLYSRIPVTPVAWSSIYTGKNPGKHGIIGFRNHKPSTYEESAVNSTLRDSRDLWEIAGAHGKKVVVVNTPLTYPPRPVNGYLVCGFMAPGTDYEFTYPSSLGPELKRAVPNYRIGTAPSYLKGHYLKELHSTVQMTGDAALYLMKKSDWDLAFVVFKETDEVQHTFYDRPGAVLSLYKHVDKFVGQFMELAGEDAYVFVVSDHGGEPINKRFNVAEYLRRQGLIRLRETGQRRSSSALQLVASAVFGMHLEWLLDVPGARRTMRAVMTARAKSLGSKASNDEGFYAGTVDWEKTTAFISSGIGLRINLKGREPLGAVEPKDYERVRQEVAKQFSELTDPENGQTVFRYAQPKELVLSGSHLDIAPDILCLPNTGYLPTEALASFDPLAVAAAHRSLFSRSTLWCGTHSPYGMIAASGPGVEKTKKIEGATLDDVAPTVLYALGMPVPTDLDGKVLTEAFRPERLEENPITWEPAHGHDAGSARSLSEEEEQIVTERLKALGYLS